MEGTERANVEARVKVLRNIQVLLDAAVVEMQQYSSVVSRLNPPPVVQMPTVMPSGGISTVSGLAEFQQQKSNQNEVTVKSEPKENGDIKAPTKETGAIPKVAKVKDEEDKEAEEIIQKMDAGDQSNGDESKENLQDEIRRRRLEKLSNNHQNS